MPDEIGLENEPTLVLPAGVYNWLRLTVQVFLPAFATLYFALGGIWDWSSVEGTVATITALTTFLGVIVSVSRRRYMQSDARFDGIIVPVADGGGIRSASMELAGDPEELLGKSEVSFKVTPVQVP